MNLSAQTIIQSQNNFIDIRDENGYVPAFVTYNPSYIEDIEYAFEELGVLSGSKFNNIMTIRFPYNKFNNLKKIVGITYIGVAEKVDSPYIPNQDGNDNYEKTEKVKNKIERKMDNYINVKTLVGVGVGVAIGHFALKTSSPLVLLAFGIGGGVLANMLKTEQEKSEMNQHKMLEDISKEIDDYIDDEESSNAEGIAFNPTVGYQTPYGVVEESTTPRYMDLNN